MLHCCFLIILNVKKQKRNYRNAHEEKSSNIFIESKNLGSSGRIQSDCTAARNRKQHPRLDQQTQTQDTRTHRYVPLKSQK